MDETSLLPTKAIQLRLEDFEGPLDLLLELARWQRVDLARISITMLVDRHLDAVTSTDRTDLIQAADWLVMAAWLTWLKSRVLLPTDPEETREAEQAGQVLTRRPIELERVRATADWLDGQPQLGWDMFERGYYERWDAAGAAATYESMLHEASRWAIASSSAVSARGGKGVETGSSSSSRSCQGRMAPTWVGR